MLNFMDKCHGVNRIWIIKLKLNANKLPKNRINWIKWDPLHSMAVHFVPFRYLYGWFIKIHSSILESFGYPHIVRVQFVLTSTYLNFGASDSHLFTADLYTSPLFNSWELWNSVMFALGLETSKKKKKWQQLTVRSQKSISNPCTTVPPWIL